MSANPKLFMCDMNCFLCPKVSGPLPDQGTVHSWASCEQKSFKVSVVSIIVATAKPQETWSVMCPATYKCLLSSISKAASTAFRDKSLGDMGHINCIVTMLLVVIISVLSFLIPVDLSTMPLPYTLWWHLFNSMLRLHPSLGPSLVQDLKIQNVWNCGIVSEFLR